MIPFIGCAGWSIPRQYGAEFPKEGTHLSRYATRFNAVEINSSFYKPHRQASYQRWADSTPADFRFAVKMPKLITHERELRDFGEPLDRFLTEIRGLGEKLGPVLVQLPPHLKWDPSHAGPVFSELRSRITTGIVCEPRHISWFEPEIDAFFETHGISRVIADPPIKNTAGARPTAGGPCYFRLHGSPRIYYSSYEYPFLTSMTERIVALGALGIQLWCIFDNTALGAATENALLLRSQFEAIHEDK